MAKIPKIRVNTPVPFPALVQGSGPVTVAKNKGIWSIGLSTAGIPQQTPPPGSLPTDLVLVWDSVAQQWITVPLSSLGGSGGGIADAPNDGVQYGRQSMGWTPITGGGSFNPASPPPIGNVAPNAGAFSSLSATGTTTLGQVTQLGIPNSAILRVGLQGRAGNSFIDFNSSGLPPDFDVRLISPTGAGTAADGSGTLQMQGTLNIKSVPATQQTGLVIQQSGPATGTNAVDFDFNSIFVTSDQLNLTSAHAGSAFTVDYTFGGSNLNGVRTATLSHATFSATSSPSNTNINYVAHSARLDINASEGGTNTGSGARGAGFAQNIVVGAEVATINNWGGIIGTEYDFSISSATTARAFVGISMVKLNNDVRGAVVDAGYTLAANGPARWNNGFIVTDYNGAPGISSIGTLYGYLGVGNAAQPWPAAWGVDFGNGVSTGLSFSGGAFRSKGFLVDSNGSIGTGSGAPSTSTSTGALTVVGGAGISGDLYEGGTIYPSSNPASNFVMDILQRPTLSNAAALPNSIAIAPGGNASLVVISEVVAAGAMAVYLVSAWGSILVNSIGTLFVASTPTPISGKCSVAHDGTNARVYNNAFTTCGFRVMSLRMA